MGSCFCGHVHAGSFRFPDEGYRLLCRDMAHMIRAACLRCQGEIPLDHFPLRCRRDTGNAVHTCPVARVDHTAVEQSVHLTVRGDHLADRFTPLHQLPHQGTILHAAAVIGKASDIGGKSFYIGRYLPAFSHRQRTKRHHAHHSVPFDALCLCAEIFGTVRHRLEIRHGTDRGIAAVCRRHGAGTDRLLIQKSRLTEMHVYIRKTGENRTIAKITAHKAVRKSRMGNRIAVPFFDTRDLAVLDKHRRRRKATVQPYAPTHEHHLRHIPSSVIKKSAPRETVQTLPPDRPVSGIFSTSLCGIKDTSLHCV